MMMMRLRRGIYRMRLWLSRWRGEELRVESQHGILSFQIPILRWAEDVQWISHMLG